MPKTSRSHRSYRSGVRKSSSSSRRGYSRSSRGLTRRTILRPPTLTLTRMYPDVAFIGQGAGPSIATYYYAAPTNAIWSLTATSGDFPTALGLTASQAGFSAQFTAIDLIDSGPMFKLFNQYQIRSIKLTFTLTCASSYNPTQASPLPSMAICYDQNDASLPADYDTVAAYSNVRTHQFSDANPIFTYTFTPQPAVQMYRGSLGTGYAAPQSVTDFWMDTYAGSQTVLYGIKGWFRNFNANATCGMGIRVTAKANVVLRSTH